MQTPEYLTCVKAQDRPSSLTERSYTTTSLGLGKFYTSQYAARMADEVAEAFLNGLPVTAEVTLIVSLEPNPDVNLPHVAAMQEDGEVKLLLEIPYDPLAVQFLENDGDPVQYKRTQEACAHLAYAILDRWCDLAKGIPPEEDA